jgi:hypothetical protein
MLYNSLTVIVLAMCWAVMTWDVADHCSSIAESYCLLLHHRRFLKSVLMRCAQIYLQLSCGPFSSGSYGGVCKLCTDVSEWPTLTIFRTEELRFYKNDTQSRFFWNVGNRIRSCSALLLRRPQSFFIGFSLWWMKQSNTKWKYFRNHHSLLSERARLLEYS